MSDIVRRFNSLDRPKNTPGGILNHWYFAIRHVPFEPAGDMVQVVQPESLYISCGSPTKILSLPNVESQADVIAPILLVQFANGLNPDPQMPRFAPWSWGTSDSKLARAIETKFRALGVREELCTILAGNAKQDEAADSSWGRFIQKLMEMSGHSLSALPSQGRILCGGCKKDASWFSGGLLKCSRCSAAFYCSRDCQRSDWKKHKRACGTSNEASGGQSSTSTTGYTLDPLDYYYAVAHTNPEAKALADAISLRLPPSSTGLSAPIRRLVITGKDTPQNFQLLLGPKWKQESEVWAEARIDILINPPRGSSSYAYFYKRDEGAPRTPRPATDEETSKIQTVRDIQQKLMQRMGSRIDPTHQDMEAVLTSYGGDWMNLLPMYQMAVNTMDRGIVPR